MGMSSDYDHDWLARLYATAPHERDQADVRYYLELAEWAQSTLEVGCGSGRVSIEMIHRGMDVTGVEPSQVMRQVLMDRLMALPDLNHFFNVWNGTAQDIPDGVGKHELVIAPYRVLNHAEGVLDQYDALVEMSAHTQPGGKIVFDVSEDPVFDPDGDVPEGHFLCGQQFMMDDEWWTPMVSYRELERRDGQVYAGVDWEFTGNGGETKTYPTSFLYTERGLWKDMAHQAGLEVESVCAGFDGEKAGVDLQSRLVLTMRKPK